MPKAGAALMTGACPAGRNCVPLWTIGILILLLIRIISRIPGQAGIGLVRPMPTTILAMRGPWISAVVTTTAALVGTAITFGWCVADSDL